MPANAWLLIKEIVTSFISDEALSRGTSIAFYADTSIAPLLIGTLLPILRRPR
jgi:membrane protein